MGEVLAQYPNQIVNGLPVLDEHLRWPGCELFLMGPWAALQVGPVARNLYGGRMACDRIVPALTKATVARTLNKSIDETPDSTISENLDPANPESKAAILLAGLRSLRSDHQDSRPKLTH
jgi:hypothetical protein